MITADIARGCLILGLQCDEPAPLGKSVRNRESILYITLSHRYVDVTNHECVHVQYLTTRLTAIDTAVTE